MKDGAAFTSFTAEAALCAAPRVAVEVTLLALALPVGGRGALSHHLLIVPAEGAVHAAGLRTGVGPERPRLTLPARSDAAALLELLGEVVACEGGQRGGGGPGPSCSAPDVLSL